MPSSLTDFTSLRALPAASRELVLAAASSSLAQETSGPPLRLSPVEQSAESALLEEARSFLNIPDAEDSREVQNRVAAYLSETLLRSALTGVDVTPVRRRLGRLGELRPDLYEISFAQGRDSQITMNLGVSREDVIGFVKQPQAVQHLRSLIENEADAEVAPDMSFYAVTPIPRRPKDLRTLVIMTTRKDDRQIIWDVLALYHSEFGSLPSEPIDLLQAFLTKYGVDVRVGQSEPRKLFLFERVQALPGQPPSAQVSASFGPFSGEFRSFLRLYPNFAIISVVFGVNETRYLDTLRRHGLSPLSSGMHARRR